MGIFNWIKQLFVGKKPLGKHASPEDKKPDKNTASSTNTAPDDRPLPSSANTAHPSPSTSFTISATMLNTITLSPDHRRLFLIDGAKLITFSLDKKGVSIGLLDGQLAVITPHKPEEEEDQPDDDLPGKEKTAISAERTAPEEGKVVRLPLQKTSQYTLTYNAASQAMGIIGATDIISTLTAPDRPNNEDPSGNCQLHLFDLSKNVLRIERTKESLIARLIAKK